MKNRSGEKIKLASIDELLGVVNEESAMEIEISKIHPFKNHPFKVLDDEKMQDLVESVKINGVLTPVLLRMDENEEFIGIVVCTLIGSDKWIYSIPLIAITFIFLYYDVGVKSPSIVP